MAEPFLQPGIRFPFSDRQRGKFSHRQHTGNEQNGCAFLYDFGAIGHLIVFCGRCFIFRTYLVQNKLPAPYLVNVRSPERPQHCAVHIIIIAIAGIFAAADILRFFRRLQQKQHILPYRIIFFEKNAVQQLSAIQFSPTPGILFQNALRQKVFSGSQFSFIYPLRRLMRLFPVSVGTTFKPASRNLNIFILYFPV